MASAGVPGRGESGSGKRILMVLLGLLALPVVCGVGVGAAYRFSWSRPQPADSGPGSFSAVSCADGAGPACATALEALRAAERAESSALRKLLSTPDWLDTLPPAATSTSNEKGQYYLRMLLREPPESLEVLEGPPLEITALATETALDGRSASVRVTYRRRGERFGAGGEATLQLVRAAEQWQVVPPPGNAPRQ